MYPLQKFVNPAKPNTHCCKIEERTAAASSLFQFDQICRTKSIRDEDMTLSTIPIHNLKEINIGSACPSVCKKIEDRVSRRKWNLLSPYYPTRRGRLQRASPSFNFLFDTRHPADSAQEELVRRKLVQINLGLSVETPYILERRLNPLFPIQTGNYIIRVKVECYKTTQKHPHACKIYKFDAIRPVLTY